MPEPARIAPEATVNGALPRLPATLRVPAATVQPAVSVFVPVSVQVLVPVFSWAEKPRYCAVGPSCEASKLALLVPPSASVPVAPVAVWTTTVPVRV